MPPRLAPHVVMGFYFYPRGGSAQVARYLCRALDRTGVKTTLFAGSVGDRADPANAHRFFKGIPCRSLDYTPARSAWRQGADPMAGPAPMHASYEQKPGVPDRIFFGLDDAAFDRQVASWTRFFGSHNSGCPDVVHLHHLTPMHEAVRAVWPGVPVVTHLHGTELKMLTSVRDGTCESDPLMVRPWVDRMRRWAANSDRLVVVSDHDHQLVQVSLPVDEACIHTIANGVDTEVFTARVRPPAERLGLWRRLLVDDPRGWRPGHPAGSVRYRVEDLAAFVGPNGQPVPVVLFAGRFMHFKRLQLLIEAHHAKSSTRSNRSVLVIVGGFPGEWEGEHPYDTVRRLGAEDVFFIGWRDHDDFADILRCSDVFAAPAVDEPFGLVYLEAMAAGVPPIATATGGPLSFINVDPQRPTGWLVAPDDVAATTRALLEAVSDRTTLTERGRCAAEFVRRTYSWSKSADSFARLYGELIDEREFSGVQAERLMRGVA